MINKYLRQPIWIVEFKLTKGTIESLDLVGDSFCLLIALPPFPSEYRQNSFRLTYHFENLVNILYRHYLMLSHILHSSH